MSASFVLFLMYPILYQKQFNYIISESQAKQSVEIIIKLQSAMYGLCPLLWVSVTF